MIGLKFLQSHSLFGGLTDEQIARIRTLLEEEHFPRGTDIVTEGQPNDRLYFIYEGAVEVLKKGGSEHEEFEPIAGLGIGDAFGEMEFIDIQPCAATVRALEDVSTLTLSNRSLYQIYKWDLKAYAILIMNMAREISRRLRQMDAVVATSLYSAAENTAPDA
jgi:CRP-like cAMP-binding protein